MRLIRLVLRCAPGIPDGLPPLDLAPGINVVLGPNASGKTTLARAVRAALWREEEFAGAEVDATFELARGARSSHRAGDYGPIWSDASGNSRPPPLPGAHLRGCFFLGLAELLARGDATEDAVAVELRQELAGGYDLSRAGFLADLRAITPHAVRKQHELVRGARKAVEEVRERHSNLARREARLALIEEDLVLARQAKGERVLLERGGTHAAAKRALALAEAECARFPVGMELVPQDVERRLAERDDAITDAQKKLEEAEEKQRELEAKLAAIDLSSEEASSLDVAALSAHKSRIEDLAREIATLEVGLAAARQEPIAEERELLTDPGRRLGRADLARLDELAHQRAHAFARGKALEAELEWVEDSENAPDPEKLAAASERLGAWLDRRAGEETGDSRRPWILAAAGALVAGALSLLGAPLGGIAAFSAGLVLLAIGLLARRRSAGGPPDLGDLGLAGPADPSLASVARRLQELGAERTRGERGRRRAELGARLARLRGDGAAGGADWSAKLSAIGLDPSAGELSALVLAARLRRTEERAEAAASIAGKLDARREQLSEEIQSVRLLARALRSREPHDVPTALQAIQAIEKRVGEAERVRESLGEVRKLIEPSRAALERRRKLRDELFSSLHLAPDDLAGLRERALRYASWKAARENLEQAKTALDLLAAELKARADLLALDEAELARRAIEARALAEREHVLVDEAAEIRKACSDAREGADLEAAIAKHDTAREALGERRRELLRGHLAEFLASDVEREHRRTAEPELVRRAGDHFARATCGRYELELAAEGAGLPLSVSEGGRAVGIEALSAGTRVQLRIALRLALAERAEANEPLPFFLDEALANSDPERFRAIAAVLAELAQGGRQVFYSSADPDPVQRLCEALADVGAPQPAIWELGDLRRAAAAARPLAPRVRRMPAPPGNASAARYFADLQVPRIDPFAPIDALHIAWLLEDDLPALHSMLCEGIETLGAVRAALERKRTLVWSECEQVRLALRARALEAFLSAWRTGRGRRLDEEVLRGSPVSQHYVEAIVAIARERRWDARALMVEVCKVRGRDERLERFLERKATELEEWLIDRGHLRAEEPLDPEDCFERVAAALEPELRAASVSLGELRDLVSGWRRAIEAEEAAVHEG